MWVIISDLVIGTCDITGKKNVECLRVQFDEQSQEFSCVPSELIKVLRLRKKQDGSSSTVEKEDA